MLDESAAGNAAVARANAIRSAWVIDSNALDADREMRRKFGARAVRVAQREAAAEDRQMIRGHGRGGGGRAAPTPRRVLLVTPQSEWGRPHGLITMRELAGGVYEFSWSREYERMHESYEALVTTSADPNMLLELLRHQPCHVGALAQLHEVASHTGRAEVASQYLCRLLWAHEASYAPDFKEAMLRGEARLRAGHPPNRPLPRVAQARRSAEGAATAPPSRLPPCSSPSIETIRLESGRGSTYSRSAPQPSICSTSTPLTSPTHATATPDGPSPPPSPFVSSRTPRHRRPPRARRRRGTQFRGQFRPPPPPPFLRRRLGPTGEISPSCAVLC